MPSGAQEVEDWRILVLRVDFLLEEPDEPTTTGRGGFDLRSLAEALPDYTQPYDTPPHDRVHYEHHLEALARYYDVVSQGRVRIESRVFPRALAEAYTLPRPALSYGNGRSPEEIGRLWRELLVDAVDLASADPDGPDFAAFDSYLVIHAGRGHEIGQLNDIRSVFLRPADLDEHGGPVEAGGAVIREAWILPEAVDFGGRGGLNGLMAKLFGHQLGLPGLSNFARGLPALGGWSLMDVGANGSGFVRLGEELEFVVGMVPPHPMAWSKARLGWIEPLEVRRDTVVQILAGDRPAVGGGEVHAVRVPLSPTEYLLLENRQQRGRTGHDLPREVHWPDHFEFSWIEPEEAELSHRITAAESDSLAGRGAGVWLQADEYDAFVPGSGVLIWHVDEAVMAAAPPEGFNNERERPGLMLVEADGSRDIGNPFFGRQDLVEGTRSDPFFSGSGPGVGTGMITGVSRFGVDTAPATATHTGLVTGLEVEVLSGAGRPHVPFACASPAAPPAGHAPWLGRAGSRPRTSTATDARSCWPRARPGSGCWRRPRRTGRPSTTCCWPPPRACSSPARPPAWSRPGLTAAVPPGRRSWRGGPPTPCGRRISPAGARSSRWAGPGGLSVLDAANGELRFTHDAPVLGLAAADRDGDGAEELLVLGQGELLRYDGAEAAVSIGGLSASGLPPFGGGPRRRRSRRPRSRRQRRTAPQLRARGPATWRSPPEPRTSRLPPSPISTATGSSRSWSPRRRRVHAWSAAGLRSPGFPVARGRRCTRSRDLFSAKSWRQTWTPTAFPRSSSPAGNGVHGFDGNAVPLSGFPVAAPAIPATAPVLVDSDGDGGLDLAVGDGEGLNLWRPVSWDLAFAAGLPAGWSQPGGSASGQRTHPSVVAPPSPPEDLDLLPASRAYCYPNTGRRRGIGPRAVLRRSAGPRLPSRSTTPWGKWWNAWRRTGSERRRRTRSRGRSAATPAACTSAGWRRTAKTAAAARPPCAWR